MPDEKNIVSILREEERQGLLTGSSKVITKEIENKNQTEESLDESADFSEYDDISYYNFEEKPLIDNIDSLKKEIIDLRNKNKDLVEKIRESKERYNSLAEYFEIISDTTISLGKKDLFSDVSDIIFQVSSKGRITYINSAVEKIAGYPSSSLIGEKFSKIIPKNDWEKIHKQLFSSFNKKEKMGRELNSFESFIITSSNKKIPVELNGKLIRNNVEVVGKKNEVKIQGSIRDITERLIAEEERIKNARRIEEMNNRLQATNINLKTAQDELRLLNQNLEKKVEERTAEIEKLLKHKIEFIGQLGHDLKTPLTPLIGLLPAIEEQEKDPELKELLGVVNRNVLFMRDVVVKTLKLERLNSPNLVLNFERFNLFELVEKFISNKDFISKDKKIVVNNNISKDFFVIVDMIEFNELLDNLFSNAVKFTPENGVISFDAKKDGDFVKVSFSDTGIGLNSEHIDHIFEEFYKVDPSRHDLDSSGLGLSICKRIVERHSGRIWAESPGLDKGSVFYFLIPTKTDFLFKQNTSIK